MPVALVRPDLLYAWKGPSLLIADTRGECGPGTPLSGYYFREARFLGTLRVEVNGEAPWLCEAAADRSGDARAELRPSGNHRAGRRRHGTGRRRGGHRQARHPRALAGSPAVAPRRRRRPRSHADRRQPRAAPRRVRAGVGDRRRLRRHPGSAVGQARAARVGRSRRARRSRRADVPTPEAAAPHRTSATTGSGAWTGSG